MTHRPSAHGHGANCKIGAVALSVLCLLANQPAAAQPSYRPAPAAYAPPLDYPAPPRGLRGGQTYECDMYGRDQAELYVPRGGGVGGGAIRGAVGGAVFGAIVGGSKGAKRGAVAGGGLGAVASGARVRQERDAAYQFAYDDCMLGFRR